MIGQGGESMQVIYMEVEGIKIAYQLTKDAVKILAKLGKFLLCLLKDAPYKKVRGQTNIKNFLMRANGQSLMTATVDKKTYMEIAKLAKRYGLLYHAITPLQSGKKGSVEIMFMEKDIAMFEKILSMIKENRIKEDVKSGMSEEQAEKVFDENNHTQTMDEFAENVGVMAEDDVFETDMKERFGEDYEEKILNFEKYAEGRRGTDSPKDKSAGVDSKKVNNLADIINFNERAEYLKKNNPIKIEFAYDPENGKNQIIEETETHVKVAVQVRDKSGAINQWQGIWIPKDSIYPPLGSNAAKDGNYTAHLPVDADVIVEDIAGREPTRSVKAEAVKTESIKDSRQKYNSVPITIGKTYAWEKGAEKEGTKKTAMIWEETDTAIKTRVPGTYGDNARFLWIDKKDIQNAYNGKSYLTTLDRMKDYQLYGRDGAPAETIKGDTLYRKHYDPVRMKTNQEKLQNGKQVQGNVIKNARGRSLF